MLRQNPRRSDADFYAGWSESRFQADFGEDETGIFMMYMRRGSGYYIDVGASHLIVDGEIQLSRPVEIENHTRRRRLRMAGSCPPRWLSTPPATVR